MISSSMLLLIFFHTWQWAVSTLVNCNIHTECELVCLHSEIDRDSMSAVSFIRDDKPQLPTKKKRFIHLIPYTFMQNILWKFFQALQKRVPVYTWCLPKSLSRAHIYLSMCACVCAYEEHIPITGTSHIECVLCVLNEKSFSKFKHSFRHHTLHLIPEFSTMFIIAAAANFTAKKKSRVRK